MKEEMSAFQQSVRDMRDREENLAQLISLRKEEVVSEYSSDTMRGWMWFVVSMFAIVAVTAVVILGGLAMYRAGQANNHKDQSIKLACLNKGGIYHGGLCYKSVSQ